MIKLNNSVIGQRKLLPVDIVLHPSWWFHNEGIIFDEDFYFNPAKRVEVEKKMEKVLYDRWGKYGLGRERDRDIPIIGPVHLAAGYLISEMLGCKVEYQEDSAPQVQCARMEKMEIESANAFKSKAFKRFEKLVDSLKKKFGYLKGDVNWSGVLNTAMDLRGENIFIDMFDKPEKVSEYFSDIAEVIDKFTKVIQAETRSTSISVNRNVRHFNSPIFLHSECSHTMISVDDYEKFLLPFDIKWSRRNRPFGIHYCGTDPHRYAKPFARVPNLDFLDVGWGGDLKILRKHLPKTFMNIRLSPVEIINQSAGEIRRTIEKLVCDSANPWLTGVCCINMDHHVSDGNIDAIFETVNSLRKEYEAAVS